MENQQNKETAEQKNARVKKEIEDWGKESEPAKEHKPSQEKTDIERWAAEKK